MSGDDIKTMSFTDENHDFIMTSSRRGDDSGITEANDRNHSILLTGINRLNFHPSRDLRLADFPRLPLVQTKRSDFGKSRTVEISEEAYVPSRPVSIRSFLSKPPPPKISVAKNLRHRVARKTKQVWCLFTDPKADPKFVTLPRGANNRIHEDRDPLRDKLRRLRSVTRKRISRPQRNSQRSVDRVPAPELLVVAKSPDPSPATPSPPRKAPRIQLSKNLKSEAYVDKFLNPLGGDIELFHQTPEERDRRIKLVESENEWRCKSDQVLGLRGRAHLSDPLIGRAPPLSKRQLDRCGRLLRKPLSINTQDRVVECSTEEKIQSLGSVKREGTQVEESRSSLLGKDRIERITQAIEVKPSSANPHECASPASTFVTSPTFTYRTSFTTNASSIGTPHLESSRFSVVGTAKELRSSVENSTVPLVKEVVEPDSVDSQSKDAGPTSPSQAKANSGTQNPDKPQSAVPSTSSDTPILHSVPFDLLFGIKQTPFDFGGNNDLFVGFARLPDSSSAPFLAPVASPLPASSSTFSEQLISARQALRPTQPTTPASNSPEPSQRGPSLTADLTSPSFLGSSEGDSTVVATSPRIGITSKPSVLILAAKFESSCRVADQQSDSFEGRSSNTEETFELVLEGEKSAEESHINVESPAEGSQKPAEKSLPVSGVLGLSSDAVNLHTVGEVYDNLDTSTTIQDRDSHTEDYDTTLSTCVSLASLESTAHAHGPESYIEFSGNPWTEISPDSENTESEEFIEAKSSAPPTQKPTSKSAFVFDPDHPWRYSGHPFKNPPEARKDCWELSARDLLGEQRPSEESLRISSEVIRSLAEVVDPSGEIRKKEKERRRGRTLSKSRPSNLPLTPQESDPLALQALQDQAALSEPKCSDYFPTYYVPAVSSQHISDSRVEPFPLTTGCFLPSSTVEVNEDQHHPGRPLGHSRFPFSRQGTGTTPDENSSSDFGTSTLRIDTHVASSRFQNQGSAGVSNQSFSRAALFHKYENSASDSGFETEDEHLLLRQPLSSTHFPESTYFSGAVSPLTLGSPTQPLALSREASRRETVWPGSQDFSAPTSPEYSSPSPPRNESSHKKKRTRDKLRNLLPGSRKRSIDCDIEQEAEPQKTITGLFRKNKLSKESNSTTHTRGNSDQRPVAAHSGGGGSTDLDFKFPEKRPVGSSISSIPGAARSHHLETRNQQQSHEQEQFLSQLGSKFHNSPEISYPPTIDTCGIPPLLDIHDHKPDKILIPRVDYVSLPSPLLTDNIDRPSPIKNSLESSNNLSAVTDPSVSSVPLFLDLDIHTVSASTFQKSIYLSYNALKMDQLQVRPSDFSSVKTKAIEDARSMQNMVMSEANRMGQAPPKYLLLELIGKGSFGRVYKAKDLASAAMVAVKIINIDESDHADLGHVDTFADFMKEVNALKRLKEQKAKNINNVIDAFPMGHSMWMITEHCGGGSVATLMRPTAPGGLQEKWIIPVLREVAEAVSWVHQAGIIHRDLKCANVLITEDGGVQLCDFGVAGIVETKLDKRSTMIGTPHWMAPELFGPKPKYGKEVDIWAFGAMVFEMATGLPPNVTNNISVANLASHLQHHTPRLVGDQYSADLKDLVAFCLEELPSARPSIEEVRNHPYILNTDESHPTSSLVGLVRAFKLWEDHGGSRRSLFIMGGAQGPKPAEYMPYEDEWNFSTTAAFDQQVSRDSNPQDVYEAYGVGVMDFSEQTSRPTPQKASRRRPPPEALNALPIPLQKVFDSNTLTSYRDISREQYGRGPPPPTDDRSQPGSQASRGRPTSDLPLRDDYDTAQTSIRDNMIDLGGHDAETGMSFFPGDTIKADRRPSQAEEDDEYGPLHDFSKPALSDPADMNPNRRTQDWKFPTMIPPASADPELSRFPNTYDPPRPAITPAAGNRPALVHHPTEPVGNFNSFMSDRTSLIDLDAAASDRMSLIDLDAASHVPELTRPSTANSDVGSGASEYGPSGNPFELERHASMYMSDFSISDAETSSRNNSNDYGSDSDHLSMAPPPARREQAPTSVPPNSVGMSGIESIPPLQAPPSVAAMSGTAGPEEMEKEFEKQFSALRVQLGSFRENFVTYGPGKKSASKQGGSG